MEILSVSLKNFKSHSDRAFQFQVGTNAICGENGAGKTSIVEAIAWTLFNYQGDYRKEDLIRNGAASAQVRVRFISSYDGRTYEISRCTKAGYSIYDPQLGAKLEYSRIEEEVIPWLRQHLGVAPGTKLDKLFATIIGIPQGTFTADFLLTAEKRKPVFDAILKVEEYRQTTQQMLSLDRYAKAEVEKLEAAIAQYEESLKNWDLLSAKRRDLNAEIQHTQDDLQQRQQQVLTLQTELAHISAQAEQIQQLTQQQEKLDSQIQAQAQVLERLKQQLQQTEQAVNICQANYDAYQGFLQAEAQLRTLEGQRQIQHQLLEQRQHLCDQIRDRQTELSALTIDLERLEAAKTEIARLKPLAEEQQQLEQQQHILAEKLQTCQSWQKVLQRDEHHLQQLQTRQTHLAEEIAQLQQLEPVVNTIPELEAKQQRYQQQLSRTAAAAQFESDLRQMLSKAQAQTAVYLQQSATATVALQELQQAVPLWATVIDTVLAALRMGTAVQAELITQIQEIVQDLAEQVNPAILQQRLQEVQTELKTALKKQLQFQTLEAKLAEHGSLRAEVTDLQTTLEQTKAQIAGEPQLRQQQQQLIDQLTQLNNPRGRLQLLSQQLQQYPQLLQKKEALQRSLAQTQAEIEQLELQLEQFATLSEQIQTQQQCRDRDRAGYQLYLQHQELANCREEQAAHLQQALVQSQQLQQSWQEVKVARDCLLACYDLQQFQTLQSIYQTAHTDLITLQARLPEMQKRLAELDIQLAELQTLQTQCAAAQQELKHREKVKRFIAFARKAYKEAGPRITERYVQSISREADKLFRELLNRPNVGLEWTRDYEILVREDAHTRRFVNLSGGEQMCAALAVRLALLRVLADLDIAFFDEPTTNMDRMRRGHLATAIANIRSFRQLFVISHDDTFEQVTENIILVEREM